MNLKILALTLVLAASAAVTGFADTSDEQALDQSISNVWAHYPQNNTSQTTAENQSPVITTTTVTTTTVTVTTNYVTDEHQNVQAIRPEPVQPAATNAAQNTVNIQINSGRQIGAGTLVLAETLGICVPGMGLAHFTLGDTKGGRIALILTGSALLGYFGAEVGVETRAIDNPNLYGVLHYGSMAVFLASYVFDIVHAPIYYVNYNRRYNSPTAYVQPLSVEYRDYAWNAGETSIQLVNFGVRF